MQDPRTRQEFGTGPRVGRVFPMDNLRLSPITPVSVIALAATVFSIPSLAIWHAQIGYTSSSQNMLMSNENFDCVSCQLGKQLVLPFNTSESMSTDVFNLIHSDVWGPSSVSSIGGSQYFVVIVDDYSCYS